MPTTHPGRRARRLTALWASAVVTVGLAPWTTVSAAPGALDANGQVTTPATALRPAERLGHDRTKPIFPMQTKPSCFASDSFGDARSGGRIHQGMDIMADPDEGPTQAVYAVVDGTLAGQVVDGAANSSLSGNTWGLKSATGTTYYVYMHLSRFADGLVNGSSVTQGQIIGYVGDTGNPGPGNYHLHFEVHPSGARTAAVDPMGVLTIPPDC